MIGLSKSRGFTIIELSIVLVVIAFFLGTVLSSTVVLLQRAKYSEARADLKRAKLAINGFLLMNGRLPCPDSDNYSILNPVFPIEGREKPVGGPAPGTTCGASFGYLPAATLGVPSLDPWGNPYFYYVTPAFTRAPNLPFPPITGGINLQTSGIVDIKDSTLPGANNIAVNVAAVIFSTGVSGTSPLGGGFEFENTDDDSDFIKAPFNIQNFDDVIEWVSSIEIIALLVEQDYLP